MKGFIPYRSHLIHFSRLLECVEVQSICNEYESICELYETTCIGLEVKICKEKEKVLDTESCVRYEIMCG